MDGFFVTFIVGGHLKDEMSCAKFLAIHSRVLIPQAGGGSKLAISHRVEVWPLSTVLRKCVVECACDW